MKADPSRKAPETPFGMRLKAARKMAGMSMEDLAAKLGGRVTKQAISKYETGQMRPSPEVLEKLVEVLKIATWGASTLKAENAHLEKQLAFDGARCLEEGALPRLALRRRGLLSLLKRDKVSERVGSQDDVKAEESTLNLCLTQERSPRRPSVELPADVMAMVSTEMLREDIGPLADRRARYLEAWHSDAAVNEIKFRAGEKLSAKTESALKYRVADHLQRYLEIESVLGAAAAFDNPIGGLGGLPARTREDVEAAAGAVRGSWDLGGGPIVNLLGLLEEKGIKVYEAKGIEGFEGLSGRFGRRPFIAVSVDFPADRIRFTAAHELGHVLCGFSGDERPESQCHAFGAAFLLPRSALERAFVPSRRKVTLGELGEIKETYGVSLQAIMYRAHGLGLVGDRQLRAFRETIKSRGWVVEEPVAYTGHERATRFRRLLHYAVAAGIMDTARAAEIAGVAVDELAREIGEIF